MTVLVSFYVKASLFTGALKLAADQITALKTKLVCSSFLCGEGGGLHLKENPLYFRFHTF